jgi:hypothetical protein
MADLYSVRASITLWEGLVACYVEMNRLRRDWLAAHEKLPEEVFAVDGMETRAAEVVQGMRTMRGVIDRQEAVIRETHRQLEEMRRALSCLDEKGSGA